MTVHAHRVVFDLVQMRKIRRRGTWRTRASEHVGEGEMERQEIARNVHPGVPSTVISRKKMMWTRGTGRPVRIQMRWGKSANEVLVWFFQLC